MATDKMMQPPITITADEVNCLIHAYFEDSGFQHSAFVLRAEGHLERSPHMSKQVARGELVYLLSKALLYTEVEAHWRGNAMTSNCTASFSLLDKHTCSLDSSLKATVTLNPPLPSDIPLNNLNPAPMSNGSLDKRKSSQLDVDDSSRAKRARTEDSMEIDSVTSTAPQTKQSTPAPLMSGDVSAVLHQKLSKGSHLRDSNFDAINILPGHKAEVFVCSWNPKNVNQLATGSKDTIVHLWNLHQPDPDGPITSDAPLIPHLPTAEQGDITSLDWNENGTLLAFGSYDATLRICTPTSEVYFSKEQHQGPIFATRFSKSGKWLLTASLDGSVCLWDIPAKQLHSQYNLHSAYCLDIEWLAEDLFASCGADGKIHIMRIQQMTPLKTLIGHENEVNQIKYNPEKCLLASCSDDKTARIWQMDDIFHPGTSVNPPKVLRGHAKNVNSILWHPKMEEHTIAATASVDGSCRLWDSVTGDCLRIFDNSQGSIFTVTWSPDCRWLATGSGDGWLNIYDAKTHEKKWSWSAGEYNAVFEIDWEQNETVNRLALALGSSQVSIIDISRLPALKS
ncbi:hypothetical protein QCA50_016333 [Cerrena zonata]|uniref:WD40 repeat-like protein n=1 Tax=Cerrena zonata TaxID=2478898 RepID=A0AAW0FMK8_9APHY